MPDEPTQFMKEYINLHYFDESPAKDEEHTAREREVKEMRNRVGIADIIKLKKEIADLKAEKELLLTYKASFWNLHKKMWGISQADPTELESGIVSGMQLPEPRGGLTASKKLSKN